MILVDTSVWIEFLRNTESLAARRMSEPDIARQIVVGDLVLLEVLQGARDESHAARLETLLRQFPIEPLFGDALAAQVARNFRTLRALGITLRRTVDLIIGTWCIVHDHTLLHADRDFDPMARHLGLLVV